MNNYEKNLEKNKANYVPLTPITFLEKKIKSVKLLLSKDIDNTVISILDNFECIIIDDFENDIDHKILYSLLNQSKQLEKYILINSLKPLREFQFQTNDLKSRVNSFLPIGIELPTDNLLRVIIMKSFSDKQVSLDPKLCDYIIKNVERSYEKMIKFLKDVDELSLSSGKSININLIKKVLKEVPFSRLNSSSNLSLFWSKNLTQEKFSVISNSDKF